MFSQTANATYVLNSLKPASQNHQVLSHLIVRGNISQLEAQKLYSVDRLASRINELRRQVAIRPEYKRDLSGKKYTRYHLVMA